jgi:hypothetical protein
MDTSKKIIFTILFLIIFIHSSPSVAQPRALNLKGKWYGISYLSVDGQKFHTSKYFISLNILKQSGLEFSGNVQIRDDHVTRMRNFTGFLSDREGLIRYFCIVAEGGDINVGYLLSKNVMKIHLKNFPPDLNIIVSKLSREKTVLD